MKLSTSRRSPLSPTHWPPDAFAWLRSILYLIAVVAAGVVGALFSLAVAASLGTPLRPGLALSWGVALGQIAFYVPLVAVALPLLPRLAMRSLSELGLRRPDGNTFVAALGGTIAMYAAAAIAAMVQYAVTRVQPHEAAVALFTSTKDPALAITFGAIAVVLAPFVEELLFRGFLFNALLRYTPVWIAAILSGMLFGAFHGSRSAFVPLACSGIVLAYVYYFSGSLVAAMLTHALFNAINLVALASGHGG